MGSKLQLSGKANKLLCFTSHGFPSPTLKDLFYTQAQKAHTSFTCVWDLQSWHGRLSGVTTVTTPTW